MILGNKEDAQSLFAQKPFPTASFTQASPGFFHTSFAGTV
jgi:hypothetical protein